MIAKGTYTMATDSVGKSTVVRKLQILGMFIVAYDIFQSHCTVCAVSLELLGIVS